MHIHNLYSQSQITGNRDAIKSNFEIWKRKIRLKFGEASNVRLLLPWFIEFHRNTKAKAVQPYIPLYSLPNSCSYDPKLKVDDEGQAHAIADNETYP